MNDPDIRQVIRPVLLRSAHLLIDEFAIGRRRADIVCISQGAEGELHLTGIEVKSDRDRFDRFDGQRRAYEEIFDFCWLATTPTHRQAAKQRTHRSKWGVLIVEAGQLGPLPWSGRNLVSYRGAERNQGGNLISILSLLWLEELRASLVLLGDDKGIAKAPKAKLVRRLADHLTITSGRSLVIEHLLTRLDRSEALDHYVRGQLNPA